MRAGQRWDLPGRNGEKDGGDGGANSVNGGYPRAEAAAFCGGS